MVINNPKLYNGIFVKYFLLQIFPKDKQSIQFIYIPLANIPSGQSFQNICTNTEKNM